MYITINLYHLMLAVPIIFTLVSMLIAIYIQNGVNAMRWFMAMLFGSGASISTVLWYWILLVK